MVFSIPPAMTVKQAVGELLARLGFQLLGAEQPVVVQEAGLAFEARGDWTALAPEESNKRQAIFVVSLSDKSASIPDYFRMRLAALGLHLKEVAVSSSAEPVFVPTARPNAVVATPRQWPRDAEALTDEVLSAYGIRFSASEMLPVPVREGLKVEIVCDRIFTLNGRRIGIFFRRLEPEIRAALQQRQLITPVELEVGVLSAREVIARLVNELGDEASYREHRFSVAGGANPGKLTVAARGFVLANPALFVTDTEVPTDYHRFFFERGLDIVYFR
jgi:hypothetical protein